VIASLLNVPRSDTDWAIFSFAHASTHQEIRQAILARYSVVLGDYVLDPINFSTFQEWLEKVQQTHTEMNGLLGLPSNDLTGLDVQDEGQLAAWIYLNWQEDSAARSALGI
jgi:response regulator of citrate/malate metabolism